jgi:hypothetical protein
VAIDRAIADGESVGDGAIRHPRGDEGEHLSFAHRQCALSRACRARSQRLDMREIRGGPESLKDAFCCVEFQLRGVLIAERATRGRPGSGA